MAPDRRQVAVSDKDKASFGYLNLIECPPEIYNT